MSSVIAGLLTAVLTALASSATILLLYPVLKRYALAKPNARSSHLTPTPQGAGIAVIAAVVAASALAIGVHALPEGATLPLTIIIVAAVIYNLPKELRIVPVVPWSLERLILLLGGLWFVNLVNFMDGIDWMTAAEVIPLTATFALLGAAHALPSYGAFLAVALGGAVLGFAFFNRPIAKVFLGDVGSLPIGLLLGWLLVLLAANGHLAGAILMPLYYLADATVTLLRRLIRSERVWQAHRTHFYQLAMERGFSVREIVGRVFLLNLCLCALAGATIFVPAVLSQMLALVAGSGAVVALLSTFARGKSAARGRGENAWRENKLTEPAGHGGGPIPTRR